MTKHSIVAIRAHGSRKPYIAIRIEPGKYYGKFAGMRDCCVLYSAEISGDLWHLTMPYGCRTLLSYYDSYLHDYIKSAIATALITNTLQEVTFEYP